MEVMINNKSRFDLSHLEIKNPVKISDRLKPLIYRFYQGQLPHLSVRDIQQICGYGSCYVFDSMPFAYYFFARNPFSLKTICKVAQAGGDTDTNAKMVGEMIGAHMGFDYFMKPENRWSVDGLRDADKLIGLADRLHAAFCSKNKSVV
jgi:ADP-ribosylglycohydrolase